MGCIFTIIMDMPDGFRGYVSANKDGSYTIFINAKLGFIEQEKVYLHELRHLQNGDFEKFNADAIELENIEMNPNGKKGMLA